MKRIGILLITATLLAEMVGCTVEPVQYNLTIDSTEGGAVTYPGEGTFVYDEGTAVNLTTQANESYIFDKWTGDVSQIADVNAANTTIVMNGNYGIMANFARQYTLTISSSQGGNVMTPGEGIFTYTAGTVVDLVAEADDGYQFASWTDGPFILPIDDARAATTTLVMDRDYSITANFAVPALIQNWYDLNAARSNQVGIYILMNDLDSATAGYEELAGPTANGGKGWQPIEAFAGTFDGVGHNISDLFINRPDEYGAALFRSVPQGGGVMNLGVVNATVTGDHSVAALAGYVGETVTNCYSVSSVNGADMVGGLIGWNDGTVTNCYSVSSVNGADRVGGLIGWNDGTVTNCYSVSSVNGGEAVGGLVGWNYGTVSNCSATGSASSSNDYAGGLVGWNYGTVSGCHAAGTVTGSHAGGLVGDNFGGYVYGGGAVTNSYSTGSVTGAGYAGGLVGYNYYGAVSSCYSTGMVTGGLLAGGLIGENSYSSVTSCHSTGTVIGWTAGGLVGQNYLGPVTNSYARGSVSGTKYVGGLVGDNDSGTVSNCYSTGNVTGESYVGGLVGRNRNGTVSKSFWDIEASGQGSSAGGTGKTTAEMKDISTFSGVTWDIIGVANPDMRNVSYIWNIVDDETYPFLSWEPVS